MLQVNMGTPIPPEPPEPPVIDPELWYCVTVNIYQGGFEPPCNPSNFIVQTQCCELGAIIIMYNDFDLWCSWGWEICPFSGYSAQELVSIGDSFPTLIACQGDCP